nr:hypothetical protein Itr_chr03CG08760 [Ipomoea trifida]
MEIELSKRRRDGNRQSTFSFVSPSSLLAPPFATAAGDYGGKRWRSRVPSTPAKAVVVDDAELSKRRRDGNRQSTFSFVSPSSLLAPPFATAAGDYGGKRWRSRVPSTPAKAVVVDDAGDGGNDGILLTPFGGLVRQRRQSSSEGGRSRAKADGEVTTLVRQPPQRLPLFPARQSRTIRRWSSTAQQRWSSSSTNKRTASYRLGTPQWFVVVAGMNDRHACNRGKGGGDVVLPLSCRRCKVAGEPNGGPPSVSL